MTTPRGSAAPKVHTASCDVCGWVSNPARSPGQAVYALRRHSCRRWLAKAAAADRRRDRAAAVDRAPKTCSHQANHQHGTYAMYVLDRCRCAPCAAAKRSYESNRQRQTAYGRWQPLVDAEPARRHVRELQAYGMGIKRIAQLTNGQVSEAALARLLHGVGVHAPTKRIRPEHADALLHIRFDLGALADGARVSSLGTSRRLQALMALGYSQARLARELGSRPENLTYLLHGTRQVTAARHQAVVELYRRLSGTAPEPTNHWDRSSITAARRYAARHGFAAPIAWDDDELDLPEAVPYVDVKNRRTLQHCSVVVEETEFLLSLNPRLSLNALAVRLGYRTREGLQKALTRGGRGDLVDQLLCNDAAAAA